MWKYIPNQGQPVKAGKSTDNTGPDKTGHGTSQERIKGETVGQDRIRISIRPERKGVEQAE